MILKALLNFLICVRNWRIEVREKCSVILQGRFSFIFLFTLLFNKYLLSFYYVPGIVLGMKGYGGDLSNIIPTIMDLKQFSKSLTLAVTPWASHYTFLGLLLFLIRKYLSS